MLLAKDTVDDLAVEAVRVDLTFFVVLDVECVVIRRKLLFSEADFVHTESPAHGCDGTAFLAAQGRDDTVALIEGQALRVALAARLNANVVDRFDDAVVLGVHVVDGAAMIRRLNVAAAQRAGVPVGFPLAKDNALLPPGAIPGRVVKFTPQLVGEKPGERAVERTLMLPDADSSRTRPRSAWNSNESRRFRMTPWQ